MYPIQVIRGQRASHKTQKIQSTFHIFLYTKIGSNGQELYSDVKKKPPQNKMSKIIKHILKLISNLLTLFTLFIKKLEKLVSEDNLIKNNTKITLINCSLKRIKFILVCAIVIILAACTCCCILDELFVILKKLTMDSLIKIIIDTTSQISSSSLNSIWSGLGIMDLSFLRWLQIIFFFIFIFLNIFLIYLEYLDKKSKNKENPKYLLSGASNIIPQVRRYTSYFLAGIGALSSIISIKNEFDKECNIGQKIEEYKQNLIKAKEECKNIEDKRVTQNLQSKSNFDTVDISVNELIQIRTQRPELRRLVAENLEQLKKTDENIWADKARKINLELNLLDLAEARALKDIQVWVESGRKYAHEICKETGDKKLLDKINEDINNSSVFNFDLVKLIKKLWDKFETFEGIAKLTVVMLLTNSLILWCLLSIILNKYSDYLIDRFNLESRYPKLAMFIRYRKKLTRYYLWSNFVLIILTCLTNILLGISILHLFVTIVW